MGLSDIHCQQPAAAASRISQLPQQLKESMKKDNHDDNV